MALILKNFAKDCISGIWKLEETEADLLKLISLSNNDKNKLKFISSEKRRKEIIATRVLMQEIGINQEIYYIENAPFCNDGFISISHSKSLVAVIWNKKHKTAIDIEEISNKILNVKEKVFSDNEINFCKNDIKKLTILWNCKETIFKIFGDKNLIFKNDICVAAFLLNDNIISVTAQKNNIKKTYTLNFAEIEKNTFCWCIEN